MCVSHRTYDDWDGLFIGGVAEVRAAQRPIGDLKAVSGGQDGRDEVFIYGAGRPVRKSWSNP